MTTLTTSCPADHAHVRAALVEMLQARSICTPALHLDAFVTAILRHRRRWRPDLDTVSAFTLRRWARRFSRAQRCRR